MVMEDYNLLDYNQHQLMKRGPTLVRGSILVLLAPTKKGLRRVQSWSASFHLQAWCQSLIVINLLLNHLCSSTSAHRSLLVNLLTTLCNLLINHCGSIFSAHELCWSIFFAHQQSAHQNCLLSWSICSCIHQFVSSSSYNSSSRWMYQVYIIST